MAKSRVSELQTPEPIATKFGMGDYVGDMTQQLASQTSNRSPHRGRPGKWVKYYSRVVFSFFVTPICARDR